MKAPDTEPAVAEEAVESLEPTAETAVEPVPEPKRGRGRPKGALNRVKIVVEATPEPTPESKPEPTLEPVPATVEPATPDPPKVRAKGKPAPKGAVEPVMATASPHETFKTAMAAWKQVAPLTEQAKSIHFSKLVNDMFT